RLLTSQAALHNPHNGVDDIKDVYMMSVTGAAQPLPRLTPIAQLHQVLDVYHHGGPERDVFSTLCDRTDGQLTLQLRPAVTTQSARGPVPPSHIAIRGQDRTVLQDPSAPAATVHRH